MKGYLKARRQLRKLKALEREHLALRDAAKALLSYEQQWARVLAYGGPDKALALGRCPDNLRHLLLHARSMTVGNVSVLGDR